MLDFKAALGEFVLKIVHYEVDGNLVVLLVLGSGPWDNDVGVL